MSLALSIYNYETFVYWRDIQILHNFRPSVRGVKKNLNTNTKYHQNHILNKPCFMQISSMNNLLKWKNIVFHVRLLFPPRILSTSHSI